MTDFENIISFENLYKAHRRARLGKRHKAEVIQFEANLSENLWSVHYDLKYGKYKVGGYHSFMIYDPKEREIQAIGYRDRVVQHSLCDNYLIPLLEKHLIYDNAACRKNKGTSFVIKRWRSFMRDHYRKHGTDGYFVKLDVSKYFPSIDHKILKSKLERIVKDEKILNLLFSIIDSYNGEVGKGLPMGNQTSQCFALLYLDELDRYIKETLRIKHYVRYMDDMLFIVENKDIAQNILNEVEKILNENNLEMNKKSQAISIKNGILFLGWRFYFGKNGEIVQTVKKESRQRMIKHIKYLNYLEKCKGIYVNRGQILSSYKGYFENTKAYRIKGIVITYIKQKK